MQWKKSSLSSCCLFCGQDLPYYHQPNSLNKPTSEIKKETEIENIGYIGRILTYDVCMDCLSCHFMGDLHRHLRRPIIQKIVMGSLTLILIVMVGMNLGKTTLFTEVSNLWEFIIKITAMVLIGIYSVYYLIKSGIIICRKFDGRKLYSAFKQEADAYFVCPNCQDFLKNLIFESNGEENNTSELEFLGLNPTGYGMEDRVFCPHCRHELSENYPNITTGWGILRELLTKVFLFDEGVIVIFGILLVFSFISIF
jgi:hypothetical protein